MKAIVFDMDGVLFNTELLCDDIWRELAVEMEIPQIEAAIDACRGTNLAARQQYFAVHYPTVSFDEFEAQKNLRMEAALSEEMPVMPGVYELMKWLRENQWRIALATSTSRKSTLHHLALSRLTGYFDTMITGDMVTRSKPDPQIYLLACEKLGTAPAETYAVEDSPNGIRSAYAAGMRVIMVPDQVPASAVPAELLTTVQPDLLSVRDYLAKINP